MALSDELTSPICTALVGLHVLTGCDINSAFKGHSKHGALKGLLTTDDADVIDMLRDFGAADLTEEVRRAVEPLVCQFHELRMFESERAPSCVRVKDVVTLSQHGGCDAYLESVLSFEIGSDAPLRSRPQDTSPKS